MKCYAIQSGDQYLADVPRPVKDSYYTTIVESVCDTDECKHYRNKSIPKAWLKKNVSKLEKDLEDAHKNLDESKENSKNNPNYRNYYLRHYQDRVDKLQTAFNWLTNAKVIELDMESPNFPSPNKVMWDTWRGENHNSQMYLSTNSTSRYSCKACGLKLKNVPYYDIPEGNGSRVCIPCLYIRLDAIKTAYEGMDEKFRTTITNELILGGL